MAASLGTAELDLATDARQFYSGLDAAKRRASQFRDHLQKTARDGTNFLNRHAKSMQSMGRKMTAGLTLPLTGLAAVGIRTAANFESSMNKVRAVSGATGAEMDALTAQARDLGASTMFSAQQAADGMAFLSQAGFTASETIAAMPSVLDLAAAGNLALADAANIASNVLKGFGLDAEESARTADVLAATAAKSNTSVQQLGDALSYVAPVAASVGLTLEETSSMVGKLGDAGIPATRAGTALRGMIAQLLEPTEEANEALNRLGVEVRDVEGNLRPLPDILLDLQAANIDATDAMKIFGRIAGSAGITLVKAAGETKELTKELENSEGAVKSMAEIMMEGLGGAFLEVQSAIGELFIAIGESGVMSALEKAVDATTKLVRWMGELPKPVLLAGTALAGLLAAAGPVLLLLAGLGTALAPGGAVLAGLGAMKGALLAVAGLFVKAGGLLGGLAALKGLIAAVVGVLSGPVGWIALLVTLVGIPVVAWIRSNKKAQEEMNRAIDVAVEKQREQNETLKMGEDAFQRSVEDMKRRKAAAEADAKAAEAAARRRAKAEAEAAAASKLAAEEMAAAAAAAMQQAQTAAEGYLGTLDQIAGASQRALQETLAASRVQATTVTIDPGVALSGQDAAAKAVGAGSMRELTEVFAAADRAGVKTIGQLASAARQAETDYQALADSGRIAARDLDAAWVKMMQARRESLIAQGQDLPRDERRMLAKMLREQDRFTRRSTGVGGAFLKWSESVSGVVSDLGQSMVETLFTGRSSFGGSWREKLNTLASSFKRFAADQVGKALNGFIQAGISGIGKLLSGDGGLSDLMGEEKGLGALRRALIRTGRGFASFIRTGLGGLKKLFGEGGLSNLIGGLGITIGALGKTGNKFLDFALIGASTFLMLWKESEKFRKAVRKLWGWLTTGATKIWDWLGDGVGKIKDAIIWLGKLAGKAIATAGTVIAEAAATIWGWIVTGATKIAGVIADLAKLAAAALKTAGTVIADAAVAIWGWISMGAARIGQLILDLGKLAGKAIAAAGTVIAEGAVKIWGWLVSGLTKIGSLIADLAKLAGKAIATAGTLIAEGAVKIWGWIVAGITKIGQTIADLAKLAAKALATAATVVAEKIWDWLRTGAKLIAEAIAALAKLIAKVLAFIAVKVPLKIWDWLTKGIDLFADLGKKIKTTIGLLVGQAGLHAAVGSFTGGGGGLPGPGGPGGGGGGGGGFGFLPIVDTITNIADTVIGYFQGRARNEKLTLIEGEIRAIKHEIVGEGKTAMQMATSRLATHSFEVLGDTVERTWNRTIAGSIHQMAVDIVEMSVRTSSLLGTVRPWFEGQSNGDATGATVEHLPKMSQWLTGAFPLWLFQHTALGIQRHKTDGVRILTLQTSIVGAVDRAAETIGTAVRSGLQQVAGLARQALSRADAAMAAARHPHPFAPAGHGHAGAGSFQTGTDFVPRTGMYELHGGEAVLSEHENARLSRIDRALGGLLTGGGGSAGDRPIRLSMQVEVDDSRRLHVRDLKRDGQFGDVVLDVVSAGVRTNRGGIRRQIGDVRPTRAPGVA